MIAVEPRKAREPPPRAANIDEMKDDGPNPAFSELAALTTKKITWAMAGLVTDPGRYMFKFGWLTITADDLAIWQAYPNAAFTLIRTLPPAETDEEPVGEECRLVSRVTSSQS
jgi:hypothetical protein